MVRYLRKTRARSCSVVCKRSSAKWRRRRVARRLNDPPKRGGYECTPTNHKVPPFPNKWAMYSAHNMFCDGTLSTIDHQIFAINRAILASVSPYFKVVFTKWLKVGQQESTSLYVDVPSTILELILEFSYTGRCEVTRSNVQALLPAADKFDFQGIVQACCDFLVRELTPENCIGIMQFSKVYFITAMKDSSLRYLRQNFKAVVAGPEFCRLTADELQSVLQHDELNSRHEEDVFLALLRWLDHDPSAREQHVPALALCVRYGLLDLYFLCDMVLASGYVRRNRALHDFIAPVLLLLANKHVDVTAPLWRPRVPYEVVFAVGGWREGTATRLVETYDARADRWFFSSVEAPIERGYHGLCALDHLIYMVGGMDGTIFYNTLHCYDPVERSWAQRSCMHQERSYVSVVALGGYVYAMGGYNGELRLDSAERYDPAQNQWYMIAPMLCRRSDACATIFNNKIYIVGGFNGYEVLRSCEMYDPLVDQWTIVPSMHSARSGVGLVAYRSALYAIGGFNGVSRLQTVECLDPRLGEWRATMHMYSPRSNFATVVLDDMIFVMGGFDGSATMTQVECYDENTCEWYAVASLALNRSALGACVVRGLPNTREYTL